MMHNMKKSLMRIALTGLVSSMVGCGGGGTTTGSGGAPTLTDRCSITAVTLSSGTTATLSKSSSALSANLSLTLTEATSVDVTSNFENVTADDWIEGIPVRQSLAAGNNTITVSYDLNSPSKSITDVYSKFNATVKLPENTACVVNRAVNITLTP